MKKLKIGAVIYAPRVTVIWEMIEEFFTGDERIRGKPEVSLFPDLGNFREKIVFEG